MGVQLTKDSIDLGIVVRDAEAALKFYRDTLGLELFSPPGLPGKFLRVGDKTGLSVDGPDSGSTTSTTAASRFGSAQMGHGSDSVTCPHTAQTLRFVRNRVSASDSATALSAG